MTKADKRKFITALTVVAEIFAEELTDTRIAGYFAVLEDLTIEQVEGALRSLMGTARFFPRPAEIRELVDGSVQDRALAAWSKMNEAALVSGDRSLYCADPLLARAMLDTFHDWIACYEFLAHESPEMIASKRKEFCGHYERLSRCGFKGEPGYLPGRHELNNQQSVSYWRDRWLEQGRTEFGVSVLMLGDGDLRAVSVPFNVETAQMTQAGRLMLTAGEQKRLEAAK